MKTITYIPILIIIALIVSIILICRKRSEKFDNKAEITLRALQSVGAKVYGARHCKHTIAQLKRFNDYLPKKISVDNDEDIYVECAIEVKDEPSSRCLKFFKDKRDGRVGYPTWDIDGQIIVGEHELDTLLKIALNKKCSKV